MHGMTSDKMLSTLLRPDAAYVVCMAVCVRLKPSNIYLNAAFQMHVQALKEGLVLSSCPLSAWILSPRPLTVWTLFAWAFRMLSTLHV